MIVITVDRRERLQDSQMSRQRVVTTCDADHIGGRGGVEMPPLSTSSLKIGFSSEPIPIAELMEELSLRGAR